MKKSYQLIHPVSGKQFGIEIEDRVVKTQLGNRKNDKEFEREMLASKDFFKKLHVKFKTGFIYENKTAGFGETKLMFRFADKYSGFWAQDYNEEIGVLAISWPRNQNGEYFKVQLDPFEILLQKDWLTFDLFKLQWIDNDRLLGIYGGELCIIDANDSYKTLDVLTMGNYKSEVEFEFQPPMLVSHCTNDLIAQNIEDRKELIRIPLDMDTGQRPFFSLHSDQETLAVARPNGLVEIFHISTKKVTHTINTDFEFISNVHILPNGKDLFVEGGPNNGTQFYSLNDGKALSKKFDLSFKYHSGQLLEMAGIGTYAVSSDGRYFAVGCGYIDNSQLHVFDYETCELVKSIEIDFVHKQFKMFFSKSGDLLFVRTDEGFMLVINFKQ